MALECSEHNESHKFICYQYHPDHDQWEHIDDIKQSFNKDENTSFINLQLKSIWESLKSSTSRYQSLSTTENEIKQYFEQLHQYLIIEEQKLKRDIINDKDTIINQIDNNINHLKYIVNIIKINNSKDNNRNDSNNNDNQSTVIEDTTTQYSTTTTIMKSITSSSSLQSFILDNNQTLFNDNHDPFNIDELKNQHNNDSSLLLDIIYKYNNKFNKTDNNNNNTSSIQSSLYELSIKQPDLNQLDSIIKQSIKLDKIKPSENNEINTTTTNKDHNKQSYISTTHQSRGATLINTTNNDHKKQSYIFTTHELRGATLISTTNNNSIEQIKLDFDFRCTHQSIVSIGEYIYVFGGLNNPNKWMKFSIKSKSIEYIGNIEGIDADFSISVCYDGKDHIYLVNGHNIKNRIDRFNIKTMQFERYHRLPGEYDEQVSTMIFKGSLYSVPYKGNKIIQFDLTNRTIEYHQIDISLDSACHDNNGNFFICDVINKIFIKYNVKTKQTFNIKLTPTKDPFGYALLMYHRESSTSSFIYSFRDTYKHKNYRHLLILKIEIIYMQNILKIEDNQSDQILEDDKFERFWCPGTSIKC
ncbi:hypothetical protein PPL_12185 [Heterostelium album PN500]|uniref:Uncharacterized protein n=1 Tax=Heterostelium pallidum (strain ATCC 26659 / Pp 5 / PN500) TaxID=670386 RepID=D3BLY1_HETP5|nr:hypothetical protein PPL_12185 [Heterostelium album PN500]EFA77582.1 hypothetical protein PPL_12185 [Heterostelium album PN500]|eukprot:XP_020429710.1 hypothetical protein PPL_12185 [Heterostelium album PN500]